mmetsp:Transcript_14206/g.28122  ORF Transcript_14206/g.28122 Transcript_14206/m.28122 type:complete len:200 (+) Transcript_14206:79-678(+)
MSFRSSSVLALPPKSYGPPQGKFWQGVGELERFPPKDVDHEEVFGEYMGNKSLQPSRHAKTLSGSRGLYELHYDTMRKQQQDRATKSCHIRGPTLDRPFAATTGYSGFIPGKESNNVCGCTFQNGSKLAYETRGKFYGPPMSGMTFTLGASRSRSLPQLHHRSTASPSALGRNMPSPSALSSTSELTHRSRGFDSRLDR